MNDLTLKYVNILQLTWESPTVLDKRSSYCWGRALLGIPWMLVVHCNLGLLDGQHRTKNFSFNCLFPVPCSAMKQSGHCLCRLFNQQISTSKTNLSTWEANNQCCLPSFKYYCHRPRICTMLPSRVLEQSDIEICRHFFQRCVTSWY